MKTKIDTATKNFAPYVTPLIWCLTPALVLASTLAWMAVGNTHVIYLLVLILLEAGSIWPLKALFGKQGVVAGLIGWLLFLLYCEPRFTAAVSVLPLAVAIGLGRWSQSRGTANTVAG